MIKQIYMRTIVLIPTIAILLASCVKEVTNITLPSSTPKLVVGCFISPQDSGITVTLTRSLPIFDPNHQSNPDNDPIPDASVVISNGINSHPIPYNYKTRQYELPANQFPILSGQAYSLAVSTPNRESVSATCTVPASNLTSLDVDFTDTISYLKKCVVKWKDIPNQPNYYRAFGEIEFINNISNMRDTNYNSLYGRNILFSDYEKDGQELSCKLEGQQGWGKVISYNFRVLHVDKEYYNYLNSLLHYNSSNDPFSEPSPVYTNIKGGLGVFAAYQKFERRFP
jgi:hypothetical protein